MPKTIWMADSIRRWDLWLANGQARCLHKRAWPGRVQFLLHLKACL